MNEGFKRIYILKIKYKQKIIDVIDNNEIVFEVLPATFNVLTDSSFYSITTLNNGWWVERDYFHNGVVRWYRENHNKVCCKYEEWRDVSGLLWCVEGKKII